jgi:hypothetical protein
MKEIERNMNNLSESLQRDQQRNSSSSTQVEDKIRHLDQRVNEYMYLMKYSSKGTLDNMMPIHPIERHSIHASMMNPSTTMTIPSEKPWPDNNGKVAMSTNLTKGIPDNQLPCHLPKEEVKVEGYSVATPPSPSLQASAEQGNATKIQQTLENSTRGALAEAEMAKMRVENRRRAEVSSHSQRQFTLEMSLLTLVSPVFSLNIANLLKQLLRSHDHQFHH